MSVLMVSMGLATGDDNGTVGKYLAAFDPDAYQGRGLIRWTRDRSKAIAFPDFPAAALFWKTRSKVTPTRPDGRPNRPLTAYSVTFETIP
jgi:hypothetical protein